MPRDSSISAVVARTTTIIGGTLQAGAGGGAYGYYVDPPIPTEASSLNIGFGGLLILAALTDIATRNTSSRTQLGVGMAFCLICLGAMGSLINTYRYAGSSGDPFDIIWGTMLMLLALLVAFALKVVHLRDMYQGYREDRAASAPLLPVAQPQAQQGPQILDSRDGLPPAAQPDRSHSPVHRL